MPPKSANRALTLDSVYECTGRLDSDSPNEADYKTLLSALKSGPREKVVAAQALSRFISKFPKQLSATLTALKALSDDDEVQVRRTLYQEITKFGQFDQKEVNSILLAGLGDSDERIVQYVVGRISSAFTGTDTAFQTAFISSIGSQSAQAQAKMVDIISESFAFTEENAATLIPILNAAFTSNVKEGLLLFRKHRKLLNEDDWKPLVLDLVRRFDRSLDGSFDDVIAHLLEPLLDNTRCLGDDACALLGNTLGVKVLPKFAQVSPPQQIVLIRGVADLAVQSSNPAVLSNLYQFVFLTIPISGPLNFSIIEAVLFGLLRLARAFPAAAAKVIGKILIFTGQPGEAAGIAENEALYAEFQARLRYVLSAVVAFLEAADAQLKAVRDKNDEESSRARSEGIKRVRTGANTRDLCRIWLKASPLAEVAPKWPSWWWRPKKAESQGRDTQGRDRGQRGGRGRRFRRSNR
jgi:hypothetical protein